MGILSLLEKHYTDLVSQTAVSKELLSSGAKTELVLEIEEILKNPLQRLAESSNNIRNTAQHIIEMLVKYFLKSSADMIESAGRTDNKSSDLHYSIVLKEDNTGNRMRLFRFFEKYDLGEFAKSFPVYFEFIPKEVADRLSIKI